MKKIWKIKKVFVSLQCWIWGKYVGVEKSSVKRAQKVEISPHYSDNKKIFVKILGSLKKFSYLYKVDSEVGSIYGVSKHSRKCSTKKVKNIR